jgi:hypothetical protein
LSRFDGFRYISDVQGYLNDGFQGINVGYATLLRRIRL